MKVNVFYLKLTLGEVIGNTSVAMKIFQNLKGIVYKKLIANLSFLFSK